MQRLIRRALEFGWPLQPSLPSTRWPVAEFSAITLPLLMRHPPNSQVKHAASFMAEIDGKRDSEEAGDGVLSVKEARAQCFTSAALPLAPHVCPPAHISLSLIDAT